MEETKRQQERRERIEKREKEKANKGSNTEAERALELVRLNWFKLPELYSIL